MIVVDFLLQSNRWKHLAGGVAIGLASDDAYCAVLAGGCTAGALELKDYQYGGKPDVVDFVITCAGVAIGFALRVLIGKI